MVDVEGSAEKKHGLAQRLAEGVGAKTVAWKGVDLIVPGPGPPADAEEAFVAKSGDREARPPAWTLTVGGGSDISCRLLTVRRVAPVESGAAASDTPAAGLPAGAAAADDRFRVSLCFQRTADAPAETVQLRLRGASQSGHVWLEALNVAVELARMQHQRWRARNPPESPSSSAGGVVAAAVVTREVSQPAVAAQTRGGAPIVDREAASGGATAEAGAPDVPSPPPPVVAGSFVGSGSGARDSVVQEQRSERASPRPRLLSSRMQLLEEHEQSVNSPPPGPRQSHVVNAQVGVVEPDVDAPSVASRLSGGGVLWSTGRHPYLLQHATLVVARRRLRRHHRMWWRNRQCCAWEPGRRRWRPAQRARPEVARRARPEVEFPQVRIGHSNLLALRPLSGPLRAGTAASKPARLLGEVRARPARETQHLERRSTSRWRACGKRGENGFAST